MTKNTKRGKAEAQSFDAPEWRAFTDPIGDPSLVELIDKAVIILESLGNKLLSDRNWDNPDTLNVSGINAAAKKLAFRPVFKIGEAPDCSYYRNLPANDPAQPRAACLTIFHPNGSAFRVRRAGQLLDDESSLPIRQIVSYLKAWQEEARRKQADAGDAQNLDDGVKLSPADIARIFSVPLDSLRKRLERWRKANAAKSGADWIENTERGSRDPQYLYRVGAVKSIILSMKRSA